MSTMGLVLLLCCLAAVSTAQNTSVPVMSVAYFKKSGIMDSMKSSDAYFDLFIANFGRSGKRDEVNIDYDKNSKLKAFGGTNIGDIQRSSLSQMLPHANCNPYDQVIEIPNDKPNVLLYPSCVRLKQCGGCCGHPDLMCKPTQTKTQTLQVTKYVYDGQQAHPIERVDYVEVEEHTACQCQCKITAADCDPIKHEFDDWDCKCKCKQGQQTCGPNMRWDENLCACRCSSVQNCGTGYRYNLATCSCEAVNDRANQGTGSNTNSNTQQGGIQQQEDTRVEETVTKADPCAHLRCRRNYKSVLVDGACRCKFSRSSSRRGRR